MKIPHSEILNDACAIIMMELPHNKERMMQHITFTFTQLRALDPTIKL